MSVTKIAQTQIRGQTKVDLQTEVSAVELAIQQAVGGTSYEDRTLIDLSLKDLSGMFSKNTGDGRIQLDVDVEGMGKSVGGLAGVTATAANFTTTSAGALSANSSTVTGGSSVGGNFVVSGKATAGSLEVSGASQLAGVNAGSIATTGNVTIGGDLFVNGSTVTVNATQMEIADKNIVIAKSAAEGTYDGAGFSLQSDVGAHFMHWNNAAAKWQISDGVKSMGQVQAPSFKVDGKLNVIGDAVFSGMGDTLHLAGDMGLGFKDSAMSAELLLNAGSDYSDVFGAGKWAEGLSFIGALKREHEMAGAAIVALSGSTAFAIAAEKARAVAAELGLHNDIVAEQTARANQDLLHDAAITAEILRAQGAELVLSGAIGTERARAVAAEGLLTSNLSAEVTRATAAELVLTNGLAAEVTRATAAEGALRSDLNAEISRATGVEAGLRSDLNKEISDRAADVLAEKNRAMAAEAVLTTAIATEKTRAEGVEAGLRSDLNAEISRATAKDAAHDTAIANEISRAQAAELVLTNGLAAEISRAQAAELVLTNNLAAEVAARIAGDAAIRTDLAIGALNCWAVKAPVGGYAADVAFPVVVSGATKVFSKAPAAYDVYLNGQKRSWNDDWAFVTGGSIAFKFAVVKDDVLEVREHGV